MVVLSYLVHYNTLLQNATDTVLLQTATFITKCISTMYNEMSALLSIKQ